MKHLKINWLGLWRRQTPLDLLRRQLDTAERNRIEATQMREEWAGFERLQRAKIIRLEKEIRELEITQ